MKNYYLKLKELIEDPYTQKKDLVNITIELLDNGNTNQEIELIYQSYKPQKRA